MGFRLTGTRARAAFTAIALSGTIVASGGAAVAACQDNRVELRGDWGTARFRVALADTPQTRARGLMFVEEMPAAAGMFFIFDNETIRTFWMRNTLIALDILYFDATGTWVSAAEDAKPMDETTLPSDGPAQYVLEVNAGLVARFGMGEGTEIRHPAIDQDSAAWPCAD